jgi:hypothetical protein
VALRPAHHFYNCLTTSACRWLRFSFDYIDTAIERQFMNGPAQRMEGAVFVAIG